jgi:hypothetical protein
MGIASECSMGISADPSASTIMSGGALAMAGDAVGSCVRREVGVVVSVARRSMSGQVSCGAVDRNPLLCYRRNAETQES